jgi:hypothetical protein
VPQIDSLGIVRPILTVDLNRRPDNVGCVKYFFFTRLGDSEKSAISLS